jgi:hypothetical protein
MTTSPAKNVLSHLQISKLYAWAEKADMNPYANAEALAEAATLALGFKVTGNNAQSALDGLSLDLPQKRKGPQLSDPAFVRLVARSQITVLEKLGLPVSAELRMYAGLPVLAGGKLPSTLFGEAGSVSRPKDSAIAQAPAAPGQTGYSTQEAQRQAQVAAAAHQAPPLIQDALQ